MCSGTIIAPDLVLTAAHCVTTGSSSFRVVALDRGFKARVIPVAAIAVHNSFVPGRTPRTQPGVDMAILRLAGRLPADMQPVRFGSIEGVSDLSVAGFGVSSEGGRRGARVLRQTSLRGFGFQRQNGPHVVAVGRSGGGVSIGRGACVGNSGGPVFAGQNGSARLVGIVSWASGLPGQPRYCGGLTAAVPVAEHAAWIEGQSRALRSRAAVERRTAARPMAAPVTESRARSSISAAPDDRRHGTPLVNGGACAGRDSLPFRNGGVRDETWAWQQALTQGDHTCGFSVRGVCGDPCSHGRQSRRDSMPSVLVGQVLHGSRQPSRVHCRCRRSRPRRLRQPATTRGGRGSPGGRSRQRARGRRPGLHAHVRRGGGRPLPDSYRRPQANRSRLFAPDRRLCGARAAWHGRHRSGTALPLSRAGGRPGDALRRRRRA